MSGKPVMGVDVAPGGDSAVGVFGEVRGGVLHVLDIATVERSLRANGAQNTGETGIQRHTLADTPADEAAKYK